ncbi:MAG: flagellar hook capping FlgD N-terminal domain-containing protein [Thermodesulfobacteriota bacterium]|nr:flagellar hook capping FlgD N-terminal domain-containing protein [Thermodesulfobacteriota bacterium]
MTGIEGIIGNSSESLQTLQTSTIGKDDFLKMMIAQLQHQDPLNPLDGTDFTAQLAQFSSLEQLSNMNDQLEILGHYQASLNNSQSISLIGKDVTAMGNIIEVDGASADLAYNLSEGAEKVTISIYDEGGNLVDTLESGSQQEGQNSIIWDCSGVTAGNYTFEMSAIDANGDVAPAYTMITGKVTGVSFEGGSPILSVNGQDIPLGSIISVNETAA